MEKSKKIKILLGLFYLFLLFAFLFIFFSKFSLSEITSYKFLKSNRELLINIKETNLFFSFLTFIILTIVWTLLLGFGSPIALIGGFIFGKWLGTILVVSSLSIGATLLYILGNFFFKSLIKEIFLHKFENLKLKFEKNEFIFLLAFRFLGGIPFGIANLLPVLFNISIKKYFISTFLGILPALFILVSLGEGIEDIIKNNDSVPGMLELISTSEIYIPIIGFFFLLILTLICKKFFIKK